MIEYLNELFGTEKTISDIYSESRKTGWENNRILIQEVSKLLHNENIEKSLSELLEEAELDIPYHKTEDKLNKDDAFKNLHRKFFDPFEYYIESIGIGSIGLNKQERILVDKVVNKIHYFIFNSDIEDFQNEKNKISKLIAVNPDNQIVIYSPQKLGLTNTILEMGDVNQIRIIDYIPRELFVLLEMYRENFDIQPLLSEIISNYTKQNL